jgi:quinolinate synthase
MTTINDQIMTLKRERKAIILAHNYTLPEVQDIADFVGDSLELSRKAAECKAKVIVFCGVSFMAETAKILSPNSIVLHPNPYSTCPMAEMVSIGELAEARKKNPRQVVIAYVNTTAQTKTIVDICCTSGNAEKIVSKYPPETDILFVPDQNLGANLNKKLGRNMQLWPGYCPTHNRVMPEHILAAREKYPDAVVLVHPECRPAVVELADYAMSTGQMLDYVRNTLFKEFIIGTESGIIHRMQLENPNKIFHKLEPELICPNMKKITLENILDCLINMEPQIRMDKDKMDSARVPIEHMLGASK